MYTTEAVARRIYSGNANTALAAALRKAAEKALAAPTQAKS